ncbi:MAG: hypothetical protein AAF502_07195 [Bacteroidota bacterium]
MIETICLIRQILAYSIIPVFILCGILYIFHKRFESKKLITYSTVVLFSLAIIVLFLNWTIEYKVREEIKEKLNDPRIEEILINEKLTKIDPDHLKAELLKIKRPKNHRGAKRIKRLDITIETSDSDYTFALIKISHDSAYYHVKTFKYDYELDIGGLSTNLFQGLK